MVLSIIAYSLSASAASMSNTFFQTPVCAQRDHRVCTLIGSPNRSGTIENRLDEQPVVAGGHADRTFAARQQVLDPFPLFVTQCIAAHRSASIKLTA